MEKILNFGKNQKGYRTTTDAVAADIRQAILDGVLKGGQQLGQDELAAHLGVSRIPVREALRQLEAQGFVTFFPNRGAVVSALSAEEILEISEARILLESHSLMLAIPNMTVEDFREMEDIVSNTVSSLTSESQRDLNCEFHMVLYRPACRPYLLGLIKNLHDKSTQYRHLYYSRLQQAKQSTKEHSNLLEACRNRDPELAVDILRKHIQDPSFALAAQIRGWQNSASETR
jgi:DNA-binding GntR family transcriptional regulator